MHPLSTGLCRKKLTKCQVFERSVRVGADDISIFLWIASSLTLLAMTGSQNYWRAVIAKAISLKQSSFLLTIILNLYYTSFICNSNFDHILKNHK